MKELRNAKFKPPNKAKDSASLNSLLGFLNDTRITGAQIPKGAVTNPVPFESPEPLGAVAITQTPIVQREPTPEQPPVSAPTTALSLSRVFLTGRLKVGKDFLAAAAGCKIFAFADPIYFLAEYFFGKQPKDAVRAFLQTAGQWGRGLVNADYPLTPERAMFVKLVRETIQDGRHSVDWSVYGQSEDVWLNALIARTKAEPAGTKLAVSGVRFQNEYTRLAAEGFTGFHVMTSAPTWTVRLQKVNLSPDSPECKNISEHLAASLDNNVIQTLSKTKNGPKLRCIWSDEKQQPPSQRLLTAPEFCSMFSK